MKFSISKCRRMTVGLALRAHHRPCAGDAVCRAGVSEMAPAGMARNRRGHGSAWTTGIVVLFIYFGSSQLLLTLSDGFTINLALCRFRHRCRLKTSTSVRSVRRHRVVPLYAAYASQTLRGALKAALRASGSPARRWGYRKGRSSSVW